MTLQSPAFLTRENGTPYYITEAQITVKLTGADTGGAFSLMELSAPKGLRIAPHTHGREDEVFFVVSGSFRLTCDRITQNLEEGACAFLPRGLAHWFEVTSEDFRAVQIASPAGLEGMFADLGDLASRPRPITSFGPDDFRRVMEIGRAYGQTMTPPGPPA
jgi:quercetin dioxygenase-like cupin family protein